MSGISTLERCAGKSTSVNLVECMLLGATRTSTCRRREVYSENDAHAHLEKKRMDIALNSPHAKIEAALTRFKLERFWEMVQLCITSKLRRICYGSVISGENLPFAEAIRSYRGSHANGILSQTKRTPSRLDWCSFSGITHNEKEFTFVVNSLRWNYAKNTLLRANSKFARLCYDKSKARCAVQLFPVNAAKNNYEVCLENREEFIGNPFIRVVVNCLERRRRNRPVNEESMGNRNDGGDKSEELVITTREELGSLGRAIRLLRQFSEIKKYELAQAAEISENHLREVESGRRSPSLPTLRLIAKKLEVPMFALVFFCADTELLDELERSKARPLVFRKHLLNLLETFNRMTTESKLSKT